MFSLTLKLSDDPFPSDLDKVSHMKSTGKRKKNTNSGLVSAKMSLKKLLLFSFKFSLLPRFHSIFLSSVFSGLRTRPSGFCQNSVIDEQCCCI